MTGEASSNLFVMHDVGYPRQTDTTVRARVTLHVLALLLQRCWRGDSRPQASRGRSRMPDMLVTRPSTATSQAARPDFG